MLVLLLICAAWIVPAAAEGKYFEVATSAELYDAITKSSSADAATIVITADFPLARDMLIHDGCPPITLTVPLGESHTLTRNDSLKGNFFTIDGGSLTIQDNGTGVLTLNGMNVSTASGRLIYLMYSMNGVGSSFTMNGGNLTNNTNSSMKAGSAVFMEQSCRFTMNDGTITGNHATHATGEGGGVYVTGGSDFTMTGGVISKKNRQIKALASAWRWDTRLVVRSRCPGDKSLKILLLTVVVSQQAARAPSPVLQK